MLIGVNTTNLGCRQVHLIRLVSLKEIEHAFLIDQIKLFVIF